MTITTQQLGHDTFDVTIRESNTESRHGVVLTDTLYHELTGTKVTKEECVRASIRFLISREPKENIFRRFDVAMIETYFPDFRVKIGDHIEHRRPTPIRS